MVVAPNVMPHAEAGAEMLHKTIEGAKSCYQEGVNVCLDAEGHATALCEFKRILVLALFCHRNFLIIQEVKRTLER